MSALTELRAKVAEGTAHNGHFERIFPSYWEPAFDAYRGSLDAAKALHEAVLPGWEWRIRDDGRAWVWRTVSDLCGGDEVDDNPARAWLLALLDAIIAKEASGREIPEDVNGRLRNCADAIEALTARAEAAEARVADARNKALEDAAALCDGLVDACVDQNVSAWAKDRAAAIRALKSDPERG